MSRCHELQGICKTLDEVTSVSSLAGYEVLTEGRGSNAGTCIINLKPWADRELTSKQINEELEEKGRAISNVKPEFYEPPAVPGFGATGGFTVNFLDKTNSGDCERLGEVTDAFMTALSKRRELKGLFTAVTRFGSPSYQRSAGMVQLPSGCCSEAGFAVSSFFQLCLFPAASSNSSPPMTDIVLANV